jgi:opacity protein-like surface antigen
MHTEISSMNKLILAGAALASLSIPALGADMRVKGPPPVPLFTWTSCFLGMHAGGGWAQKDVTDPVQLVQDAFEGGPVTTGVTTASISPSGGVVGGQFGCDYQFAPNWVIGVEGAASGADIKSNTLVVLPLGDPGDSALVTARTDFLASVTGRLGYAVDRWLFYVRGGAAWAGDKFTVTGAFLGTGFGFEGLDTRPGWTVGAGVEWAFSGSWSARLEYDYYGLGTRTILMTDTLNALSGFVDVKQNVQTVKVGVNFHVWGEP